MRFRSSRLLVLGIIIAFALSLSFSAKIVNAAEPTLLEILNNLGFTNVSLSSVETFPAGNYEVTLYAEFAGYHDYNELSYYPVGTSNFYLLISGPEGNEGYITPPITKTFSCSSTFGMSMYVTNEDHRYFTQLARNPDGRRHARVYLNLDDPDMYLIGFENQYGYTSDRDYNDMVFSLQPQSVEQHYLNVETDPSGITTISGEGWYDDGTDVNLTAPATIPVSTGTQYQFSYWDIDGVSQGPGNNPITVHMDANYTATAHYICQHYLTMSTNFGTVSPGNDWYDAGSVVSISATPPSTVSGERYVWNGWTGTGSGSYSGMDNPGSITMNASIDEAASWIHQYKLTMATNYGMTTPSVGEHWYDAGTIVEINAMPPSTVAGERYSWNGWAGTGSGSYSGSNNPASVTMNAPTTETASWTHEYRLTISANFGTTTPSAGEHWYAAGSAVEVTATPPSTITGERYVWNGWIGTGTGSYSGSNNPATVTMNAPITQIASWTHQYRLTMATNYGTTSPSVGEHWYDAGSTVEISTTPPSVVSGEQYLWNGWTATGNGSYSGADNPASITMNGPIDEVASWTHQYRLTMATNYGTTTPSVGEYWYDAGSIVEISATPPSSASGERYVWNGWTGIGSSSYTGMNNPASITMNGPITETASWTHQYYLTVTSPYDTPGGEGWYDSGGTAYAALIIDNVDHGNGTRRIFTHWSVDASGTNYAQSNPILMDGPKTVVANWKTQYLLEVLPAPPSLSPQPTRDPAGEPGGSWWYDASTTVTLTAQPVSGYTFSHWDVDGTSKGSGVNPIMVSMDEPHTATAHYIAIIEYYLTVKTDPSSVTTISGEGWYGEGESVILTAPEFVDVSSGVRYRFSYWDVDGSSREAGVRQITVIMDANHTATAHYILQYYLTVTSPYDSPTPSSSWFDAGTNITASVTTPWAGSTGTRHVCTGWTGTGSVPASGAINSVSFAINAPSSITWNWKTQYYLTVKTDPSGIATISGEGWYDASTSVPLIAPSVTNYNFLNWEVDGVPQGTGVVGISVGMNAPHTATAYYEKEGVVGGATITVSSPLLIAWIGTNVMLIAAIFAAVSWLKRRK